MQEATRAQYELDSGIILNVTPLTAFARQALKASAARRYPEPERAPYEQASEGPIPSLSGEPVMLKAELNAEWLALYAEALKKREQCYIGLLLNTAVSHPEQDKLIAEHALMAQAVAKELDGPASAANVGPWVLVLLFVLAQPQEIQALTNLAQGATPLSEGELVSGLRFFRGVVLPGAKRRASAD